MKRFLLFILFLIFTINIYSIKIENNMAVDSYGNSVNSKNLFIYVYLLIEIL